MIRGAFVNNVDSSEETLSVLGVFEKMGLGIELDWSG